jgi:hypothetical protein
LSEGYQQRAVTKFGIVLPTKEFECIDYFSSRAIAVGCSNAQTPDLYGHYREARYSQTKHHWWWKVNFIFGKIKALRDYNGIKTTSNIKMYLELITS